MTRPEATEAACAILAVAYRSIGDYSEPADGFCDKCPGHNSSVWNFQSKGSAHRFALWSVVESLERLHVNIPSLVLREALELVQR